jgi:signal transduction histidine kinase
MLGYVIAAVLAVVALALARYAAAQRRALHERQAELRTARERTTALALLEERAKIARELHDVVTHRLSLIVLQAQGALAEPEQAAPALRAIRQAADEGLEEMRGALGLLREEGAEPELEPQPGLAQLPGLVERARAAGMPVTYHVDGRPRPIPAGLDLSAYRIVQEALANVHRHAGGAPASVRVGWRDGSLSLQVRDTGHRAPKDEDEEQLGMRERVRAHGGDFRAGRVPGGGYEVVARLPL